MDRFEWRPWVLVAAFSLVLFLITAGTYNALGVVLPAMVGPSAETAPIRQVVEKISRLWARP